MAKSLSVAPSRIWFDTADPGDSETMIDDYCWWINTSSGAVFFCTDSTVASQIWIKLGIDGASLATLIIDKLSIQSSGPTITSGAGAPSASEPKGSLYLRTDGSGINDRMYIATDSSGTWTAVVTVL